MSRIHFFEGLERDNNYLKEYDKLEQLCADIYSINNWGGVVSINSWIENHFRTWKRRGNYIYYDEVREQLGFSTEKDMHGKYRTDIFIDIEKYLLFCEMILNIIEGLSNVKEYHLQLAIRILRETIEVTIAKAGLEIRTKNSGDIIIVETNAIAIEVAEENPQIADVIIEYNQYLLRGDIERKRTLLKLLSDSLEPKKNVLNNICKKMKDDFFFLVNNMNVRHNNINPEDAFRYNRIFAEYTDEEVEACYDLIYEQGLALYVQLSQQERNQLISKYKSELGNK